LELSITAMTEENANAIAQWTYDDIYSLYNNTGDNIDGYMDGTHFACTNLNGELVGYFCFGEEARIPTEENDVYDEGFLDIGLGMRPDLCGKGYGVSFLSKGLEFAQELYKTTQFRLTVVTFNERAIKAYTKAGFLVEREVTHLNTKGKFIIMKCVRENTP